MTPMPPALGDRIIEPAATGAAERRVTMKGFTVRDGVLLGAGVVIALLFFGGSLASLTPLLFLGGCLLMHVFMMRGMDHGGSHAGHDGHSESGVGPARERIERDPR